MNRNLIPTKKRATLILEFKVIKPTNELETKDEILELSQFGEYCPKTPSLRGYSLKHLIQNPKSYKVYKVMMQGKTYII